MDTLVNKGVVLLVETLTGLLQGAELKQNHSDCKQVCLVHYFWCYLLFRCVFNQLSDELGRQEAETLS